MAIWIIWLIISALLVVAETFTLTAVLGLLGGAALVAAGAAAVGLPVPLQLVVFAIVSTAGLVIVRPIAARHKLHTQRVRFGVDALAGRPAHVVREVTTRTGIVRIGGEEWTARSIDDSVVIPAGTTVDVILIDGVTAVVHPRE